MLKLPTHSGSHDLFLNQTPLKIKVIIQLYSIEVHKIRRFPSEKGPSEIKTCLFTGGRHSIGVKFETIENIILHPTIKIKPLLNVT